MRARLTVLLATLVAFLSVPSLVAADASSGSRGTRDNASIDAFAWAEGESASGHPVARMPAWLQLCTWNFIGEGEQTESGFADGELGDIVWEEDTWIVICPSETLVQVGYGDAPSGILEIFPDGEIPQRLVNAVINEAYEQTPVLAFYPESSPPGTREAPLIAQLETWLWIDEADWAPVSVTASVPPLSVTTTAIPVRAVWAGGDDPSTVVCGRGVPYDLGRPEESQSSDCTTFFRNSSAVADYELGLEVTWEVSYSCSSVCGSGTLDPIVTASTRPVRVAELQAVITRSGSS